MVVMVRLLKGRKNTLRGNNFSIHHPAQASCIIADINVFLNLSDSFWNDLSHLKTHQLAKILNLFTQSDSNLANNFSSLRSRNLLSQSWVERI